MTGFTPAAILAVNTQILGGDHPGGGSRTGRKAFDFPQNTTTLL